ncbi:hypothetical protein [Streptomyces sp. NPDC008137]|uniref:hypothetical protein n=1 Tax=Streptomyces sp. NPDC008137 TaxID=3364813 RepID=UPI0036EB34A8
MSTHDVIEHALRVYFADSAEPNAIARELLKQHDGQQARAAAEQFPGELAMLRQLVRTLRTVVRENHVLPEVRRLLWHHATDEAAAHAEMRDDETSSREQRLAQLLDTIRTHRGAWPARRVVDLRRFTGGPTKHTTARGDLAELYRRGHLRQHGGDHDRFYTLKLRKDGDA